MSQSDSNRPVHEVRVGGVITASVWRNEVTKGGDTIVRHSVQIQKRYFDKDDQQWKTSSSYFPDDIPKVVLALNNAWEWIMTESREKEAA